MSIWHRIWDAINALAAGETLSDVFARLRTAPEKSIGFTIAVIALGAKIAKADGQVTRDEVAAFREVFTIAPEDEASAAKLFNMARQDVAGFETYAKRVVELFGEGCEMKCDLLEGLFHIALADGEYHPGEDSYLSRVAEIFGVTPKQFAAMRARLVPEGMLGVSSDPYTVLGVSPSATASEIRSAWKTLVRENHPDRMVARGVPIEALRMAEARLAGINAAWDALRETV